MRQAVSSSLSPRLIVGLEGPELTARERGLLGSIPPAGIILFSRNVRDAGQLRRLATDVSRIVQGASGYPPLVAADHEGGRISVLAAAVGAPPPQMAIGRASAAVSCGEVFRETARRLRRCAVNTLLAPVADVNTEYLNPVIGVRSFGEESGVVARLVHESVRALRGEGVVPCLKHFPGHGSSRADSHRALPFLPFTLEELEEREMEPFARGIDAGAETVMIGHIAPRGRFIPASLDAEIIALLRDKLGFGGVVMTDALEMAGVSARPAGGSGTDSGEALPDVEIAARALEAGNDLLVFSRPFGTLTDELDSGAPGADALLRVLSGGLADASLERIRRLRASLQGENGALAGPAGTESAEAGAQADVYRAVACHAVRRAGDRSAHMPVIEAGRCALSFFGEREDFANDVVARFVKNLASELGAALLEEAVSGAGTEPSPGEGMHALFPGAALRRALRCETPGSGEQVEIIALETQRPPGEPAGITVLLNRRPIPRRACEELCGNGALAVVAGWPYAARFLPPGMPAIVTDGAYDAAAGAAAEIITGRRAKTD